MIIPKDPKLWDEAQKVWDNHPIILHRHPTALRSFRMIILTLEQRHASNQSTKIWKITSLSPEARLGPRSELEVAMPPETSTNANFQAGRMHNERNRTGNLHACLATSGSEWGSRASEDKLVNFQIGSGHN